MRDLSFEELTSGNEILHCLGAAVLLSFNGVLKFTVLI
jgi:hypothetical protein